LTNIFKISVSSVLKLYYKIMLPNFEY